MVTVDLRLPHGSYSTYVNHGCRCRPCRDANAKENADQRRRRHEAMVAGLVSPPHGKYSTYVNYICRCGPCTAAATATAAAVRARSRGRVS